MLHDTTRAGADLQHAHGLRALRKAEPTLDLPGFLVARRQVEHGVGLALLGLRVHAAMFGKLRGNAR